MARLASRQGGQQVNTRDKSLRGRAKECIHQLIVPDGEYTDAVKKEWRSTFASLADACLAPGLAPCPFMRYSLSLSLFRLRSITLPVLMVLAGWPAHAHRGVKGLYLWGTVYPHLEEEEKEECCWPLPVSRLDNAEVPLFPHSYHTASHSSSRSVLILLRSSPQCARLPVGPSAASLARHQKILMSCPSWRLWRSATRTCPRADRRSKPSAASSHLTSEVQQCRLTSSSGAWPPARMYAGAAPTIQLTSIPSRIVPLLC
jgi:hypothetical protein